MTTINVITRDGTESKLPGDDGVSVMETIRDGGIDEMLAICGGALSCATCHVYVDEAWLSKLPPMSDEEDELLEGATDRQPNSRLSCQIVVSGDVDGLKVAIAPE